MEIRYWFSKKVAIFFEDRSGWQWTKFCNTYDHGDWFLVERIKIWKLTIHEYSKWSHGDHGWGVS